MSTSTFTVGTASSSPFVFQWQVESPEDSGQFVDIASGSFDEKESGLTMDVSDWTTPKLGVSNVQLGSHGNEIRFRVRVSDVCINETSDAATLTIVSRADDVNADCLIDGVDFAELQGCLNGPSASISLECQTIDTDLDADIDLMDLKAFMNLFTGP